MSAPEQAAHIEQHCYRIEVTGIVELAAEEYTLPDFAAFANNIGVVIARDVAIRKLRYWHMRLASKDLATRHAHLQGYLSNAGIARTVKYTDTSLTPFKAFRTD